MRAALFMLRSGIRLWLTRTRRRCRLMYPH
jgi:hypothetical protein